MIKMTPYHQDESRWDAFIESSHNGTFLHSRRYLNYHGNRFEDQSLIALDHHGRWAALFPAARDPDDPHTVTSHPGITFGGIIYGHKLSGPSLLEAIEATCNFYAESGYKRLRYRTIPHIYHRQTAEDDRYALAHLGASIYRCDLLSLVSLSDPIKSQVASKAHRAGIAIQIGGQALPEVWHILQVNLAQHHGATPVHTLSEIQNLFTRFPDRLQCLAGYYEGELVAALVTYNFGAVTKLQYSTATDLGRRINATTALIVSAISIARHGGCAWFDLGSSHKNDGTINEGLYRFKRQFATSSVAQEIWEIPL